MPKKLPAKPKGNLPSLPGLGPGKTKKVALKISWTRDGHRRPAKCNQYAHAAGCRPGRPLCWRMRQEYKDKYGVCECGVVPWPHRAGWCASKQQQMFADEATFWREKAEWEAHKQATREAAAKVAPKAAPPGQRDKQTNKKGKDYPF